MVVYAALTVTALLPWPPSVKRQPALLLTAVMVLFAGTAGVIMALLGAYTAEVYPWPSGAPQADGLRPSANQAEPSARPDRSGPLGPGGMRTAAVFVALPMALAGLAVAVRGSNPQTAPTRVGSTPLEAELDALLHSASAPAGRSDSTIAALPILPTSQPSDRLTYPEPTLSTTLTPREKGRTR